MVAIRRSTVAAIAWLTFLAGTGQATVYSADLEQFVVAPDGEFLEAKFDFRFSFQHIEAVSLELTVGEDIPGPVCSGSTCTTTMIAVALYDADTATAADIDLAAGLRGDRDGVQRANFSLARAGIAVESRFISHPTRIDPDTGQLINEPLPGYLLAGKGAAKLQEIVRWTACAPGGLGDCFSNTTLLAPTRISTARLIVEGVAVPEPSCLAIAGGIAAIAAFWGRIGLRRYGPRDDGTFAPLR